MRKARRRRRGECEKCGAPALVVERLERYRGEREELWVALERVTEERDDLLRRLVGILPGDTDAERFPPPPGARTQQLPHIPHDH